MGCPDIKSRDAALSRGAVTNTRKAQDYAESIKFALADLVEEDMTLREIAEALNERRIPTARGGQWAPQSVSNVIKRLGLRS